MATGLISPYHLAPASQRFMKMIKPCRVVSAPYLRINGLRKFSYGIRALNSVRDTEEGATAGYHKTVMEIKADLNRILQDINRGIFGVTSVKKLEIEGLVKMLEAQNPTPEPTQNLDKVSGCWKLIYSTITILGSKRTKLGLRDFVTLGEFFQTIDVSGGKAVNVIEFNVRGLKMLNGQLTIEASFKIASKSRVDIRYENSTITPDQLMNVFRKNYDLLLSLFNPDGWLEISYP